MHHLWHLELRPVTARMDAGSSSAEYVTHQFLRYIEDLMNNASITGSTPVKALSVVEHFSSALSSRQSELSTAKVIEGCIIISVLDVFFYTFVF